MDTTQNYLPIKDILNDLIILKDGSVSCVIKTSAVNFGLISENEQLAIISSFAGLLNSLSFSIQLVIRSKRLDISSYLKLLDESRNKQNNPLLRDMMGRYRTFIESVIRENEVLDKQFYVVISVSYLELGVINNIEKHFSKAITILLPRRDHVIRQLERIGLKATQLNTEALTRLFFDIFNGDGQQQPDRKLQVEPLITQPQTSVPKAAVLLKPQVQPQAQTQPKNPPPQPQTIKTQFSPPVINDQPKPVTRSSMPFVVEELPDEYSSV
ncbi:hypothetical protein HYW46_06810 [Candidatus Daviesbacteria bacterium]|nr:hypothetical protein [Candidatus Daviesbacteria bacterium]